MADKKLSEYASTNILANDDLFMVSKKTVGGYETKNITKTDLLTALGLAGAFTHDGLKPNPVTQDWIDAHHPKDHTHDGVDTPKINSSDLNWDYVPGGAGLTEHNHTGPAEGGLLSHNNLINITTDDHHPKNHRHGQDGVDPIDFADIVGTPSMVPHTHQSDATGGRLYHAVLDGIGEDDHHAKIHDHSDDDNGGNLSHGVAFDPFEPGFEDMHHPKDHTIDSHLDTSATGGQLNTLVNGGDASALHSHYRILDHWNNWGNDALGNEVRIEILSASQSGGTLTLTLAEEPGAGYTIASTVGTGQTNQFRELPVLAIGGSAVQVTHAGTTEFYADWPVTPYIVLRKPQTDVSRGNLSVNIIEWIDASTLKIVGSAGNFETAAIGNYATLTGAEYADHNFELVIITQVGTMVDPEGGPDEVPYIYVSPVTLDSPANPDEDYTDASDARPKPTCTIYERLTLFAIDTVYAFEADAFLSIHIESDPGKADTSVVTVYNDEGYYIDPGPPAVKVYNPTLIVAEQQVVGGDQNHHILVPIKRRTGWKIAVSGVTGDVDLFIRIIGLGYETGGSFNF